MSKYAYATRHSLILCNRFCMQVLEKLYNDSTNNLIGLTVALNILRNMVFAIFYQIFSQESVIILEKSKVTERKLEKIMDASGTSKKCIEKNTGQSNSVLVFWCGYTVWKVPKYGYFSDPYFPVFCPNTGKYGPEKTPYFGHFSRSVNDCIGYEYENEETHQLACRFPPRSITLDKYCIS